MQLIGMLDSPYVRRVAVSLRLLGIPFEHRALSVFAGFDEFKRINPVVKAPTLLCDDGEVLMDSTLILQYAEAVASGGRTLLPRQLPELQHALHRLGLALATCDKAVQIVYERNLRPADKVHEPWLTRVSGQLRGGMAMLEEDVRHHPLSAAGHLIMQDGITIAVMWQFTQAMLGDIVPAVDYPMLRALSESAEQLGEFKAAPPTGPGVPAA